MERVASITETFALASFGLHEILTDFLCTWRTQVWSPDLSWCVLWQKTRQTLHLANKKHQMAQRDSAGGVNDELIWDFLNVQRHAEEKGRGAGDKSWWFDPDLWGSDLCLFHTHTNSANLIVAGEETCSLLPPLVKTPHYTWCDMWWCSLQHRHWDPEQSLQTQRQTDWLTDFWTLNTTQNESDVILWKH